ncbi:MAG TPA: HAD domain-containing protein [Bacteroidales bacterium]|jgi:hypothetical protein|nr:MAG: hypothetical protein BWY74_01579 [Firmicutes bacterium ADurb.Bin419]HPY21478.1 HAD domain-containing protein [Bacteroidales bacterium]HQP78320.1 HAD domain-containing protein [Bacteroidales bacterium]
MLKVIFLDFDGVLNSGDNSTALHYLMCNNPDINRTFIAGVEFDERCVRWLRYIINCTDAKIVISSSWKFLYKLEELQSIWNELSLPGEIIGYTPCIDCEFISTFEEDIKPVERGKEIQRWLDLNKVEKYCIIDDDYYEMLPDQIFVQTDPEFGLTHETAKLVVEYLTV